MRIDTWTLGAASLRAMLPASTGLETVLSRPAAGSLEESHQAFRRITESNRSSLAHPTTSLFGGLPLIGNLTVGEFAVMVAVAGVATLLVRGVQKFFEARLKPFGELSELNQLVHNWAVMDENDARSQARRIGEVFVRKIRTVRNDYENAHFQVSWTIDPKEWAERDLYRQRLTTRYAKDLGEAFQQFAQGLSLLAGGDWGGVYKEVFGDFLQNVAVAIGPITRWQPPLNDEDLANFRSFQTILRREVLALEMKLEALSEPHAA